MQVLLLFHNCHKIISALLTALVPLGSWATAMNFMYMILSKICIGLTCQEVKPFKLAPLFKFHMDSFISLSCFQVWTAVNPVPASIPILAADRMPGFLQTSRHDVRRSCTFDCCVSVYALLIPQCVATINHQAFYLPILRHHLLCMKALAFTELPLPLSCSHQGLALNHRKILGCQQGLPWDGFAVTRCKDFFLSNPSLTQQSAVTN